MRKKIKKILLDMDNVLVDFESGLEKLLGCKRQVLAEYDIQKSHKLCDNKFWNKIDLDFWCNLKPTACFNELVALDDTYVTYVVSSPGYYRPTASTWYMNAVEGKLHWLCEYMPWIVQDNRYFLTQNKAAFASPDTVLIDDAIGNCSKFITSGGHAILYPGPMNILHMVDPMKHVMTELERLEGII